MGRILVVDDDGSTVRAMATLLRQDGHEVEPFTSGDEAIAALRGGSRFDAVVTDFEMPRVDGAAVARAAREHSPHACIVGTNRSHAARGHLQAAGACVVLEKPIVYEAMLGKITACMAEGGNGGSHCARHAPGGGEKLMTLGRRT